MKPSTTHVIEIELGTGDPSSLALALGQAQETMSVGRKGAWRLEAADVHDVHAFIHFDGASLFLQAAHASAPLFVDGKPASAKSWSELVAPATIEMGAARLHFRAVAQARDSGTLVIAQPAGGTGPMPNALEGNDLSNRSKRDSSTRIAPVELAATLAETVDEPLTTRAPTGAVPRVEAAGEHTSTMVIQRDPPLPTGQSPSVPSPLDAAPMRTSVAPPAPQAPTAQGSTAAQAPTVRRAAPLNATRTMASSPKPLLLTLAILLPLCLVAAGLFIYGRSKRNPRARATTAATAPPPASTGELSANTGAPPSAVVPPPLVSSPAPLPSVNGVHAGSGKNRTLERQAADAVAVNDYAAAAALYERLAQQNPKSRVFAEAARIMRAKARAGSP